MAGDGFSSANGRTVFDNGVVKIWQCPNCNWWRQWQDEHCTCCGAPREVLAGKGGMPPQTWHALSERAGLAASLFLPKR
jgi:hypothetical protein